MDSLKLDQFLKLIGSGKKEIFVTTFTEPVLKKTGNPYEGVKKITRSRVNVNFNYANDVNLGRLAEGKNLDFQKKERAWGTRVDDTCVIEHKGAKYIECELVKKEASYYIDKDRNMLTVDQLTPFLPAQKPSAHQGLENPIIINTYKLANIKEVEIDTVKYLLTE